MYGTLVQHRPWASDVFPPPPLDALLAARPAAWCCQWMSCCPCPPTSISCRSIRASMDAFHPTSALPMGSRSNPCATGKVRVPQAGSRYRSWYEQVRHAQHRLASALACPGRDSMRVMYPSYLGNNQRLMSIAPGRVGRLASACRHLPAVVPSLSTHTPWVGDGEPLTHTTSRSLRSNSQEWGQSNAAKELGHQRAKLAMLAGCPRLAGTGTRRQDHGMADCDASRPLARSSVARTSVSPGSPLPQSRSEACYFVWYCMGTSDTPCLRRRYSTKALYCDGLQVSRTVYKCALCPPAPLLPSRRDWDIHPGRSCARAPAPTLP